MKDLFLSFCFDLVSNVVIERGNRSKSSSVQIQMVFILKPILYDTYEPLHCSELKQKAVQCRFHAHTNRGTKHSMTKRNMSSIFLFVSGIFPNLYYTMPRESIISEF